MFAVGNIIACVFWGVLMALAIVALVFLLCKAVAANSLRSPMEFIVLAVLLILLSAQGIMTVGAMYAKGYVSDIGDYASTLVSTGESAAQSVADFNSVREQITDEFPVVKPILDQADTGDLARYVGQGHSVVDYVVKDLREALNAYILRRVLWMVGFVVVALILVALLPKKRSGSSLGMDYMEDHVSTSFYEDY